MPQVTRCALTQALREDGVYPLSSGYFLGALLHSFVATTVSALQCLHDLMLHGAPSWASPLCWPSLAVSPLVDTRMAII